MYFIWSLYIFTFFLMAVSKKTTDTVAPQVHPTPIIQPGYPAVNNSEWVSQSGDLTPEQIAANQIAADAAFKAANYGAEERIAKEESIPSMTPEELQAEFGWTVPEAISVLRDAISRSQSIHKDKMNDHLDKIEATSQL